MLSVVLVPVLLGLSMLAQRPISRWLRVRGQVWPLVPFAPEVPPLHRLAVRGGGALFTCLLVLAIVFVQTRREELLTSRVKVSANSAAAAGGVQSGDLITAVDGIPVHDFSALRDAMLGSAPTRTLTVLRGGQTLQLAVTLREGLLGVQPEGESKEATDSEAVRSALHRLFVSPWLLVRMFYRHPQAVLPPIDSRARAALLTVTLSISWWLMLAVELAALALGMVLAPPSRPR